MDRKHLLQRSWLVLRSTYIDAVTPEQRTQYAAIIDTILRESDLKTISEKKIRKALSEKLGYDVSDQKVLYTPGWV
jgi:hypothetical protein